MIYDNSFTLEQMMETARGQMTASQKRLRSIAAALDQRLEGQSRFRLLGGVLVSLGWAAVFVLAYVYSGRYLPRPYRLALLSASLLLALSMVIDGLLRIKYYGTILRARRRLVQMYRRVTKAQSTLAGGLQTYLARQGAQWELPLDAGASINQEAGRISAQLSGMEAFSTGFLPTVKTVLFYAACAAWTLAGAYVLFGFVPASIFAEGLSHSTLTVIMAAAMVIACCFEVLFARMIRARTDSDVGNLTLLALAVGPVIFAAVTILILIVYFIFIVVLCIAASLL